MRVKTILLLEDEASIMRLLRRMLQECTVIEADSAGQALQLFTDHGREIDILLADVMLPTSSGIQVALIPRSQLRALPVILTSGYPVSNWSGRDSADLARLGSHSVAILHKPIQARVLRTAVYELIGAPQAGIARTA